MCLQQETFKVKSLWPVLKNLLSIIPMLMKHHCIVPWLSYWNILYKCIGIELRSICGRIDFHVSLFNDNRLQNKHLKTSKNYIFRVLCKSGFNETGGECYVLVVLLYKWVVFTCRVVYAYSEWISANSENNYGILMLLLKACTNLSKNVYLWYFSE